MRATLAFDGLIDFIWKFFNLLLIESTDDAKIPATQAKLTAGDSSRAPVKILLKLFIDKPMNRMTQPESSILKLAHPIYLHLK